jgi:hypothetical protein
MVVSDQLSVQVSGSSIATLVVFILSIICVIFPFSIPSPILLPYVGRKSFSINLTTAPIIAILVLWVTQCLGPHASEVWWLSHSYLITLC